jgi:hypothetical protein
LPSKGGEGEREREGLERVFLERGRERERKREKGAKGFRRRMGGWEFEISTLPLQTNPSPRCRVLTETLHCDSLRQSLLEIASTDKEEGGFG